MKNLILPVNRKSDVLASRRENESSLQAIQNEMNRMFDQFFTDPFQMLSTRFAVQPDFFPRLDVSESDKAYTVSAELPGMDEKDVQISLEKNSLILSGEKKSESEAKEKTYHRVERSYGSFQRVIPFETDLDEDKASAVFKNGVLTVTLPKSAEAMQKSRKIEIKKE
jgi:HSP20 family protein